MKHTTVKNADTKNTDKKNTDTKNTTAGNTVGNNTVFTKKIWSMALPMAFRQFMLALVGASDAVMLGRLDQNSMSAVSLASQVTFVFNLFMMAFLTGENMFMAQYYGKKDYESMSGTAGMTLRISCAVAVLFWAGTVFAPKSIMRFFTNEQDLIITGGEYLKIVGISYFLSAVAQVFMTAMKNCGAVNECMVISSATVVLNILLNAVFIFGLCGAPAMGIRGAALATVLATAVQMVWSILFVRRKRGRMRIRLFDRNPDLGKRFRNRTAPVLLNELIWGGGITMYSVIMGHLGTDAVAANSIANIAKNLIVCLCLGLGSAGSILVGNELGADRLEEAREAGKILTKTSLLCGILSGLFLLALSPVITGMVSLTAAARSDLRSMLVICSYYLIGKSVNSMTVGGIFPAGGAMRGLDSSATP